MFENEDIPSFAGETLEDPLEDLRRLLIWNIAIGDVIAEKCVEAVSKDDDVAQEHWGAIMGCFCKLKAAFPTLFELMRAQIDSELAEEGRETSGLAMERAEKVFASAELRKLIREVEGDVELE